MPAHQWRLTVRGYDAAGNAQKWEHATTRGDAANPAAAVQIVPPFRYAWAHRDGHIPGRLEPATVSVTFAGKTRADLPALAPGDILETALNGSWWPTAANEIMKISARVTDVALDFDPSRKYPARVTYTAADILADLNTLPQPQRPALDVIRTARGRPAESPLRAGEMLTAATVPAGVRVMVPNTIPANSGAYLYNAGGDIPPADALDAILNSLAPGGDHLAAVPRWNCGPWPADPTAAGHWEPREWAGNPASFALAGFFPEIPAGYRPAYILQPHNRKIAGTIEALNTLTFAVAAYTTTPRAPDLTKTAALALIPAGMIDVPVAAVLTTSTSPTILDLAGGVLESAASTSTPWSDRAGSVPVKVSDSAAPLTRSVSTALDVVRDDRFARPLDAPRVSTSAAAAAQALASPPAPPGSLAFDRFTVRGDRFPTADTLTAVCRRLTPRPFKDMTDRGHAVTPVVIYDIDESLALPDHETRGYATSGEITIDRGGEIVYTVTLTPAALELADTPGVFSDAGTRVGGIVSFATSPPAWTPANSAPDLTFARLMFTKI